MATKYKLGMLILSAVFILSSLSTVKASSLIENFNYTEIDTYVRSEMASAGINGLAYGVIKDDRIVYMKGFGAAEPGKRPITPQTPFQICSIGKTFTNLAVARLVNKGDIDFNAPVQRYIPWFQVADGEVASSKITVKDLTYHTSGFSNVDGNSTDLLDSRYNPEDLVRMLKDTKLNRPIGAAYEYSNINYIILGYIIERVTGQSYNNYVEKEIFRTLDMNRSFTSEEAAKNEGLAGGHCTPFGVTSPYNIKFPGNVVCEGWHFSTVEDMCHFMIAYVNKGIYNGRSVVSQTERQEPIPEFDYYDIHWQPQTGDHPNIMIDHSGGSPNYESRMIILPNKKTGIIVLSDTRTDALPVRVKSAQTIAQGIMELLTNRSLSTKNTPGIGKYYLAINIALMVVLLLLVLHIVLTIRWISIKKLSKPLSIKEILIPSLDIILSVFIILCPKLFSSDWSYFFLTLPDSWFLMGVGIILAALAIVRVAVLVLKSGKQRVI